MRKNFRFLALVSLVVAGCTDSAPTPAESKPLPELASAVVQVADVTKEVMFDGVIEAVNQATVAAQTSGRVVELPVDVGDFVEKGELIVRLTDTEQRARVESAQAALDAARAQFADAQANFARIRELFAKQGVAKATVDQTEANFKSAQARVNAAEAGFNEASEGLAHTTIYAPYSGIVVSRATKVGETVAPGTPLLTGLSLAHLRAQVDVPQQHIGALRQHGLARVQLGEQWVETRDLRIPPSADLQSHTFKVLVTLPEGEYSLFPGTLVKIAFVSGTEARLHIPAAAVARRGDVSGVYVIKDQRLEFRQVALGRLTRDNAYTLLAGVQAGERVALDPIAAARAYKQLTGRGE